MQFARLSDEVQPTAEPGAPIDISAFPGTWINSNPDTTGVARLKITPSNGNLSLQVFAIGPNGPIDWGTEDVLLFTTSPITRLGAGFTCVFDFGFAEARLQGMIMKGLLVLAQFHYFKDGSGRANYFTREYFGLEHGRY
jgi:hypothetical protein